MAAEFSLPPALILLVAGAVVFFSPRRWRSPLFLLFSLAALFQVWRLPDGASFTWSLAGFRLDLLRVDGLSRIFALIFSLITFIGGLYSFHLQDRKELVAALIYAAGSLGVTYAGDYLSLFIFWEIMALCSTYLVWASGGVSGYRAGMRYLCAHLVGGGLLLTGILTQAAAGGSLAVGHLSPSGALAPILILLGVLLNAAAPPLHAWLPDAYPNASVGGAVFLSALTTKSAVYLLIRVFAGWKVLVVVGVAMALYGVIYAILADDIRRILAYHIISQVGYMVAGAGIGTQMALNGSIAHAYSHILYKALLFMGAGAVLYATGRSKLSELGGLARALPTALIFYMAGAFSISGVPLFNGFISKSLVVAAAAEAGLGWAYLLLQLAAVGTFLSVGLKLPYFTFFHSPGAAKAAPLKANMNVAMGLTAFLCLLYGIRPGLLYGLLPFPLHFQPYTGTHLSEAAQLLLLTLAAFWLLRRLLLPKPAIVLDIDWLYRRPAALARRIFVDGLDRIFSAVENASLAAARRSAAFAVDPWRGIVRTPPGPFSPDRYRPRIGTMISLGLLMLLLVSVLALVRSR